MIDQVWIAVCGTASIWLANSPGLRARKWAPIIGLCAQPAWFYSTYQAQQWGMLALSIVYAFGWARGIYTYWIRKERQRQ